MGGRATSSHFGFHPESGSSKWRERDNNFSSPLDPFISFAFIFFKKKKDQIFIIINGEREGKNVLILSFFLFAIDLIYFFVFSSAILSLLLSLLLLLPAPGG